MITQELVLFIKQQLQEGKSKEQIAQTLVPHGWQLEDINAVFMQIMPSAQPVQPMAVAPEVRQPMNMPTESVQVTQPMQSVTVQAPVSFMDSLMNPSGLMAGVTFIITVIASTLIAFYVQTHQVGSKGIAMLANQNTVIASILGVMALALLMSGGVTKLVAKILSIEPRTFAKTLIFVSVLTLITSVMTLVTLVGVPVYVVPVAGVIIWIVLFWYYFKSSIAKAIGAFFLNTLVGAVIAGIVFFITIMLGIGALSNLNQILTGLPRNQQVHTAPLVNQNPVPVVTDNVTMQTVPDTTTLPVTESVTSTETGMTADASATTALASLANPELPHVKDAFPVGFPLPSDEEVITATVLSATNFEGIRYILDYTSTHSVAYLRNAMKSSLEKAGYVVAINETNQDYRVITASKVVRNTARTFKIILEKTVLGASISVVFTQ